ncbi:Multiple epidermal growth factor-like domains protein 8, partial [Armadillidium nasatum]
ECFLFSLYTSVYQYGACRVWIDEDHTNTSSIHQSAKLVNSLRTVNLHGSANSTHAISYFNDDVGECQICEAKSTCSNCLKSLGCGWCYSQYNPTIGLCTSGDFAKPHKGLSDCSILMENIPVPSTKNLSSIEIEQRLISWTYSLCPDVDECMLDMHDCHENATCVNTDGGFNCSCPRGFTGNGRTTCTRTCFEMCVHGKCSGSPNYVCECNLGWTGSDCSINCGCNNHSKCQRVGVCEHCQGETTGDSCELCRPGSYGNATTVGCKKCECNGHWDEKRGRCDQTSGRCYCIHNTRGYKCDQCEEGFYGDPRNGGKCYRQQFVLQVNVESINIDCQEGTLYIYEGLPDFVSVNSDWDRQNLIGTFCSGHSSYPAITEAKTGIMTIFYEMRTPGQGFTASYQVLRCPDNPGENRICASGKPVCSEGWRGAQCSTMVCPSKCLEGSGRGKCDIVYGRCVCNENYVGDDCSILRQDHLVVLQELFNPLKISSSLSHLQTVLPRFGHTLIVDHQGSLWVFGGYSLSRGPLNDIQQFDTRNRTWVQVTVNVHPGAQPPSQRYFHASAYVTSNNEMYVYGGMNKTHFLKDFWKFNIATESWEALPVIENLPALAGHSLTCRSETSPHSLILIGGFSAEYGSFGTSLGVRLT